MSIYIVEVCNDEGRGGTLGIFSDMETAVDCADEYEIGPFQIVTVTMYALNGFKYEPVKPVIHERNTFPKR